MGFAERYVSAVNSSDLRDDAHHHATEALIASALADRSAESFGTLLARVRHADPLVRKAFESGTSNLASLLRIWEERVTAKGKSRGWIKMNTAWDADAAFALFRRVARESLAYWLDPNCKPCGGTGNTRDRRICPHCSGSKHAPLPRGGLEREKTLDMVSELNDLLQSHLRRASALSRREG